VPPLLKEIPHATADFVILAEFCYQVQPQASMASQATAAAMSTMPVRPSKVLPFGPLSQRPNGPIHDVLRSYALLHQVSGHIHRGKAGRDTLSLDSIAGLADDSK